MYINLRKSISDNDKTVAHIPQLTNERMEGFILFVLAICLRNKYSIHSIGKISNFLYIFFDISYIVQHL